MSVSAHIRIYNEGIRGCEMPVSEVLENKREDQHL